MSSSKARAATIILDELCHGDARAADRLLPLVYEQLRVIARRLMKSQPVGHTLQPTALVHEAFTKLVSDPAREYEGRNHFLAVAAKAMRQLLVDHARRRGRDKRAGGWARVTLDADLEDTAAVDVDVLDLHDALEDLAGHDERSARIVELRYLGGLTVPEVSSLLGMGTATVERKWRFARAWLADRLGSSS